MHAKVATMLTWAISVTCMLGSGTCHVGICNMHVETQHLFLMGAESDYLEFRVRLTTSAQRFAEVSAAGPLRNPGIQKAEVLGTAAPRW